ncbi:hypothetical protein [Hyphomonas sp.]|jgi:hypothetical protein|uniref:hypothetical protein n=1 Tax=Hyphomonas sp. TaxID=87 RepID=UPI000C8DC578|nr:hypothetical protein [Hyphomonas sp.]MAL46592.1 hypothetical protein [Hyphomonas sp.]
MAEHMIEISNMEKNEELFMEKMGFPRDAEGLELSDEQLINFLLLCYQGKMLPPEDMEETEDMQEMEHDDNVKVKIIKMDKSNVHEMMNDMLGSSKPEMM